LNAGILSAYNGSGTPILIDRRTTNLAYSCTGVTSTANASYADFSRNDKGDINFIFYVADNLIQNPSDIPDETNRNYKQIYNSGKLFPLSQLPDEYVGVTTTYTEVT
jgi:hypothetical protein